MLSKSISTVAQFLNDEERRAFVFFQAKTVHRILGQQDASDWIPIFQELGYAESAVKHVVVALASLHESLEPVYGFALSRALPKHTSNCAQVAALKHYNKSIKFLRSETLNMSTRPDIIMILCILFMSFEQLQRNDAACLVHLTAGLELVSSWRTRTDSYTKLRHFSRPLLELINGKITPALQRLRVQFTLCMDRRHALRNTGCPPCLPPQIIPLAYDSLASARIGFDRAMNYIFSTLEFHGTTAQNMPNQSLLITLRRWKQALDDGVQPSQHSILQLCAHKLLNLYYYTSVIITGAYGSDLETVFDGYNHIFQKITTLAQELVKNWKIAPQQYGLLFSFDLGITPPMFFVASRCRHAHIRRRALAFMLQSTHYRGTCSDRYSGLCAERIIEIEEEGLEMNADCVCVPEHQRIRKVSADVNEQGSMIVMRYTRAPFDQYSEIYTTSIPLHSDFEYLIS